MFVVTKYSDESQNYIFYDKKLLAKGSNAERSAHPFSECLVSPKAGNFAYNFSIMTKEKLNAEQVAIRDLLHHVWEMLPSNLDEREAMRDHLKEIYLNFMHGEGGDLTNEKEEFIKLYWCFDWFLKLCKNVDSEAFIKFLQEKEI